MSLLATFKVLRESGSGVVQKKVFLDERSRRRTYDTFLSHSSGDDELLPGVITILENHGAVVYIDDGDARLPEKPSPETARILRRAIRDCRRVLLFVTTNTKDSRWIPWELGLGDGMKGADSVALFPAAELSIDSSWSEREYLGLYRRVVWGRFEGKEHHEWMVLDHIKNNATPLAQWIQGG